MLKDMRESFAPLLRDPQFQQEFIAATYAEEGAEGVIRALREIARANRSMSRIARSAGVTRTSLYRSLDPNGNPAFKTVRAALNALGMDFAIIHREQEEPKEEPARSR